MCSKASAKALEQCHKLANLLQKLVDRNLSQGENEYKIS